MIDYENTGLPELFDIELNEIEDLNIRKITREILKEIDEKFPYLKIKPACSSGKYHPIHDLGIGGLIRHTKVVAWLIKIYCRSIPVLNPYRDILLAAAILHDLAKYHTNSDHTDSDHPNWMADYILNKNIENFSIPIADLIRTHHGIWTTNRDGDICSEEPKRFDQWIFHIADLTSAQSYIHINFDDITGEIIK